MTTDREWPAQHNWGGGRGEKKSSGAKYLSSILKFEVKNRQKRAEESKT